MLWPCVCYILFVTFSCFFKKLLTNLTPICVPLNGRNMSTRKYYRTAEIVCKYGIIVMTIYTLNSQNHDEKYDDRVLI